MKAIHEMTPDEYRATPEYHRDKLLAYSRMKKIMDGAKADKKAMQKYWEARKKERKGRENENKGAG